MASNGVILLNLENRNAAGFQRLSVPDSYEKASGALTSGTYVTVYKWLYEGFMLAPSLCDAVDADDHINLVDRTNGGVLSVYPDDTITLEGIPVEGDLIDLTVSSNGVYYPPEGKRGFSSVRANVDLVPHPSRALELNVIENGTWVAPFGYDGFNPVNVAVPSQSDPVIEPLSVSANGVYTAPPGINGYSPITVNVSGGTPVDPYAGVAIRISLRTAGENDNSLLVEYGSADNNGNFTPNGDTVVITSDDVTYDTLGPKLLPGFMAISFYKGSSRSLWLSVYTEEVQKWLGSVLGWNYISQGGHPAGLYTDASINTVWGIWRHPGL